MSVKDVDLTVINPTKKTRVKKENTNLSLNQIGNIVSLINNVSKEYLEFIESIKDLPQTKGRFQIIEDEIELLGSYFLLYFSADTLVVKKKVHLIETSIGFDIIDPDGSYFNRRKKVIREVFGNFIITIDKLWKEIFDSEKFLIPSNLDMVSHIQIDKKNYGDFLSMMNMFLSFLINEKEKRIIISKIKKINTPGNIKPILETEIKPTRSNGGWFKILIFTKDKERYKIYIDTTASIRMEIFSGKEWNYLHHFSTSEYPICEKSNHNNTLLPTAFDKIIEDCINFITDFEDLN